MKVRPNTKNKSNIKVSSIPKTSSADSSKHDNLKYFLYIIVFTLPVLTAYYYYNVALTTNQFLSFPLDDPWIHLTFAKNIVEYFSFSYYKNELVTAGSTSPLYVFVAALGFLFTNNEMILSYVLGTVFFALSSLVFYKITLKEFSNDILITLFVCFVYIFDYSMNFIAVSGMETTMFILLLLLGVYLYKSKKAVALGIVLGLIFWTRPDGSAFIAAFVLDYFYTRWFVKEKENPSIFSSKEFFLVMGIFLIFLAAYFSLNLYLSGTILSNTYGAKIAYYTDLNTRITFLKNYILDFFTFQHYIFLLPGFVIVVVKFVKDIIKRKYNQQSILIFFIFLFLIIYLIKLPMASRFGRYFMPMIPFYIILSMYGYYFIINSLKRFIINPAILKILNSLVSVSILILALSYFQSYSLIYTYHCKYVFNRQVNTAYWFRDHTVEGDIIAAHDIGAIGYYGGRKIIDIAGLINPDLLKYVNLDNYNEILMDYFNQKGVTYTSFFREWFLIPNQIPELVSPNENATEALYTYKFIPNKSRVLPKKINVMLTESNKYILESNGSKTISSIDEILKIEPDYSLAYFYKAYGYLFLNDNENYEKNIEKALQFFPDFKDALIESGKISMQKGNMEEAKIKFKRVIELEPNNVQAMGFLKQIDNPTVQQK